MRLKKIDGATTTEITGHFMETQCTIQFMPQSIHEGFKDMLIPNRDDVD